MIKLGITQGDLNGVGMEVILKTFNHSDILELCTPVIYGSIKGFAYHRKGLNMNTSFTPVNSAAEAIEGKLNVVNTHDEVKIEYGVPSIEVGNVARISLERAVKEYTDGLIDALVTAPINKQTIKNDDFPYNGHTDYLEATLGNGAKSLMLLIKDSFRIALATTHIPISQVATSLNKEIIKEKVTILNNALRQDFGLGSPRIAIMALNPHAGDGGVIGTEEQDFIIPAINELKEAGILAFGPYPADGFFGSGRFDDFDAILAMYHDQGLAPFKALVMDDAINYTAGLPVIRTSPAHGTAYDITGKGIASEHSFRQAIYTAIDIYNTRTADLQARSNPLKEHFAEHHSRRDS